jgi:hypothetical protein
LVVERSRGRGSPREINKESDESAEDTEHNEQEHEHARKHPSAELRVSSAETYGARLCGVRRKEQGQRAR